MDVHGALQTAVLIGSKLNCPDYDELGSHFGLHGERVEDPTQLKDAVQAALNKVQDGSTAILNVSVFAQSSRWRSRDRGEAANLWLA
jgi:thiamine pyrophosphate-dependent acetolactate synthase large subunit-like protein